jgi:hypothetical protein
LELTFCGIRNHALELRAVVCRCPGNSAINVFADYLVPVAFGEVVTRFQLALNRFILSRCKSLELKKV